MLSGAVGRGILFHHTFFSFVLRFWPPSLKITKIKGIVINDKEHVISQFADDTTLIFDGSRKSLISALETLEYYAQISGLRINNSKTKMIWIGSKKHSEVVYTS